MKRKTNLADIGTVPLGAAHPWQEGEVRPTSVAKAKPKRSPRRPDPFAAVAAALQRWFEAQPWHTSRELLGRLQAQCPGFYPDGQLRALQRLKEWRREAVHRMVFGTMTTDSGGIISQMAREIRVRI